MVISDIHERPVCFVVMGYEKKTDPVTSKVYDLDKSYRSVIKKGVEAAGFRAVRSDMVIEPGHISRQMYQMLMDAELVVCDLTTLNVNAVFELGVRMALRPRATVVIAAEETKIPFNLNQQRLFRYKHGGEVIDYEDAEKAQEILANACRAAAASAAPDSLIYSLFHSELEPPRWRGAAMATASPAAHRAAAAAAVDPRELVWRAKKQKDWAGLIQKLKAMHEAADVACNPLEPFFTQQWALATYKEHEAGDGAGLNALLGARVILQRLEPQHSTDAETLGLWAAIHKRLSSHPKRDEASRRLDLNVAIASHQKGYILRNDHYNGVNYAFLMLQRAVDVESRDPARALRDRVEAGDAWRQVIDLCGQELELPIADPGPDPATERLELLEDRFWRTASLAQCFLALEDSRYDVARERLAILEERLGQSWMMATTDQQELELRRLLGSSGAPAATSRTH